MEEHEKRGYLLENFRLFHLRTQRAPEVEQHYHAFCKLLFLVSGRGSYSVEGSRYLLQPGDVVLINSHTIHRPEFAPETAYERMIIYISPEFLQRESAGGCDLLDCFTRGHVLRLREPGRKRLFALAAALEQELSGEAYGRDIASHGALLRLLVQIGREQRRSDSQTPDPVLPANERVRDMMAYMDSHLEEELDIDRLAEKFYISKYHMMRLFHRETGYTVYHYLLQRRLMNARTLIAGGMRATEACYRSGFGSYSSFTRAYSRHFGTTPTGRRDAAHRREDGDE